jgi:hypothetical protein
MLVLTEEAAFGEFNARVLFDLPGINPGAPRPLVEDIADPMVFAVKVGKPEGALELGAKPAGEGSTIDSILLARPIPNECQLAGKFGGRSGRDVGEEGSHYFNKVAVKLIVPAQSQYNPCFQSK